MVLWRCPLLGSTHSVWTAGQVFVWWLWLSVPVWVVHVTIWPALPVPHTGSAAWSPWQVLVVLWRCPLLGSTHSGTVFVWSSSLSWQPNGQCSCIPFGHPTLGVGVGVGVAVGWTTWQSASWSIHAPLHFLSV